MMPSKEFLRACVCRYCVKAAYWGGVYCGKTGSRQFTALSAICGIALAWNAVKPLTLIRLWRKFLTSVKIMNLMDAGCTDDEITIATLAEIANQVPGGGQVDGDNVRQCLDRDVCEVGFEMLSLFTL
jgi:hypothetical protein